nr:MAG TPA: hypothetical protein [Caudoviricetes sp.]
MENRKIKKILDAHSVPYFEKEGRIYADYMLSGSDLFEEVEDLTGWSMERLRAWLGY